MQAPFDNIVQHLFHQPSLQSVTVDELERMAQAHPYFAAAHFLLLKKMQQTDHPHFTDQLHKTTLYFNNPLWLQFLLQPETVQGFTVLDKSPFIETEAPAKAKSIESHPAEQATIETAAAQADTENNPLLAAKEPVMEPQPVEEAMLTTVTGAAGIMDVISAVFQEEKVTEPAALPAIEVYSQINEDNDSGKVTLAAELPIIENHVLPPEAEALMEATPIPQETWLPDAVIIAVNEQESHSITASESQITAQAESLEAENQQTVDQDALSMAENAAEADATDAPVVENIAPERPLLKNITESPAVSSDTLFEPYHTVDYFASQGIKLSKLEADAKDKLGRQLKSFTEWLKTMKRLPQVSIDKLLSENEESKVVADAIHSIENKEVITEAMAEVFEKQGMNEKAVEVYQKLSLLNPAKSTYFAAKIAILKH